MKVTFIAPIKGIIDTVNEMQARGRFAGADEVEVVPGDLETGVAQAKQAIKGGTDVIISRGGTASMIAENVEVPVVEIQVSAFDILRTLRQLEQVTGTIGVVFARRLLFECKKLGELIGVKIQEFFMETEKSENEKIFAARHAGISTFIGDARSVRMLKQFGLKAVTIESAEDAIMQAFIEAINIYNARRKEREKAELFRTIINASTEGIIAIDKNGHINVLNSMAETLFQLDSFLDIGKYIGDLIPDDQLRKCLISDEYEREGVKKIEDKMFAIKRIPIKLNDEVVGAVANIEAVTQLQNFEHAVRQKLNKKGFVAKFYLEQLIGSSPIMMKMKERVCQFASTDGTVLITGESGTGKECIAQSIHNLSKRKNGPFVAINCAALPESLLESELFGYDEGAFTGAKKGGKPGLFEMAHLGTIFLDEIGEMPLLLQARILRVLQEKEVMRVGSDGVIPVDVRIVSATNQDLMSLVDQKKFRADLYYRLDVLRLHLPPLRERIDDISDLAHAILCKVSLKNSKHFAITDEAVAFLQQLPWKGNIRELENVLERVALTIRGSVIDEMDLRQELSSYCGFAVQQDGHESSEKLEKQRVEQILSEEKYNYTQAAKRLGMSRTTLWRKLREWKS
jgi:transcriptional regulator with PAS, ATPase and Fis domain